MGQDKKRECGLVNRIGMVFPYYEAPKMLTLQLLNIAGYRSDIQNSIEIVVVDDGSPNNPAYDVITETGLNIPLSLYRIKQDIPWNAHGARNLGVCCASDGSFVFVLDVDQMVPACCMEWLFDEYLSQLKSGCLYTFSCRKFGEHEDKLDHSIGWMLDKRGEPNKPCPNTYLVRKEDFWTAGGYNEDYCGTYGGDGDCMSRLFKHNRQIHLPLKKFWIVMLMSSIIADAMAYPDTREYYKKLCRGLLVSKTPVNPLRFEWTRLL